jgi:hypothetical protein
MTDPVTTCPVCKVGPLRRHCPPTNATCTWHRCTAQACGATVDLKRRRGYSGANEAVTW